jgi:hypothetical protein
MKDKLQEVQKQCDESAELLRQQMLETQVQAEELGGQLGSLRSELEEVRRKADDSEQDLQNQLTERDMEFEALKEELSRERSSHAQSQDNLTGRAAEQERRLREALELKHTEQQALLLKVDELQEMLSLEKDRLQAAGKELAQEVAARLTVEVIATDLREEVERMKGCIAGEQVKTEEGFEKLRVEAEQRRVSHEQEEMRWREEQRELQEQVHALTEKGAKEAEASASEMVQQRKIFEELKGELQEVKRAEELRANMLMQAKEALRCQVSESCI